MVRIRTFVLTVENAMGVRLRDDRYCDSVHRHVHNETDTWTITSTVPIDDVIHTTVLDRILPGLLGAFVYPDDAVFSMKKKRETTCSDLRRVLQEESSNRQTHGHINHISIREDLAAREDPSDEEEEDEEAEDEEGDDRCDPTDVVDATQWDDEDECE